jgi:hypothetical protein
MTDIVEVQEQINIIVEAPEVISLESSPAENYVLTVSEDNTTVEIDQVELISPIIETKESIQAEVIVADDPLMVNIIECYCPGGGSGSDTIGEPTDGSYADGLNTDWSSSTKISDAFDIVNEELKYLAPSDAEGLGGTSLISVANLLRGRLSGNNTNYKTGQGAGSLVTYILHADFLQLLSANGTRFNKADEGLLRFYANAIAASEFNLAVNFMEAQRFGNQTYPPKTEGDITVLTVGMYNNFPKWQRGSCQIDHTGFRQGYNFLVLSHEGMVPSQMTNNFDLFRDIGVNVCQISMGSFIVVAPVIRYLSGVRFYGRGSTFTFSGLAANVFDYTYHETSPVIYSSSSNAFGNGIVDFDDSCVTGVSNPPLPPESMTMSSKMVTVPLENIRDMNAKLFLQSRKPWCISGIVDSGDRNIMVDAYATTSDYLHEYFDDEYMRLPNGDYGAIPTLTNRWLSAPWLVMGEAQVYNGNLIYPQDNFAGREPSMGQPNYNTFTGDQRYFRAFYKTGSPHSSGTLRILGINSISPAGIGEVNVELKIPGVTGWLDLGKPFDSGTFQGIDGDGCKVIQNGNNWSWTTGTFTTAYGGWMIVVRVTLRDNTKVIQEISEVAW